MWLSMLLGRDSMSEDLEYHIGKQFFLKIHQLPPHFAFAHHLRTHMTKHITAQLEVQSITVNKKINKKINIVLFGLIYDGILYFCSFKCLF
jgi:hypothetical protein